jgi:hypothetical protein
LKNRDFVIAIGVVLVGVTGVTGFISYLQNSPSGISLPNLSAPSFNQGFTTTAVPVATSTTTGTYCNPAHPLTMTSVTVGHVTNVGVTTPALFFTWSNCSKQPLQFYVETSPLTMTLLTYGQTSTMTAELSNYDASSVPASATSTRGFALSFFNLSPNAVVQSVKGNVTATDPVTAQGISTTTSFIAKPAG